MALEKDFKPQMLKDHADATGLRGNNLTFLTDLTREQLYSLFTVAEMLEPYWKSGISLLPGKVLCTMFFQPSTRTRFSTETAMLRLGGSVISESDPLHNSSAAKDESLWDTLKVVSQYSNILAIRHTDDERVLADLPAAEVPVISCGYGNITHPTQGLLDMYTTYRALGKLEGVKVLITSPDLSRARSGHSFALGLARMGAEIIYSGPKELPTPDLIMEKIKSTGAKCTVHNDPTSQEQHDLIAESDLVYLPGCSVPKGLGERDVFMERTANYYISLEQLEQIREKTGKIVGIMHSLPRFEGEFDKKIDDTAHELYFKQVAFSVPLRMALIASMVGVD